MSVLLPVVQAYYADKLIQQYKLLPKASATASLLAKTAVADMLADDVQNAFTLATAVGPQLDILAKYIGVNRGGHFLPGVTFWSYWNDAETGSSNPYNADTGALNGDIYTPDTTQDLPNSSYSDAQMLFVLPLKVQLNHFNGTFAWIQSYLAKYLPNVTVVDNLDMSITYSISAANLSLLPLSATDLLNYLPHPMGCGSTLTVV
jgi:hypothetical protein